MTYPHRPRPATSEPPLVGPAIPAADRALESGSADALQKLLSDTAQAGVRELFEKALARKKFGTDDVAAGRRYVEAYVVFLHYVERIYDAARGAGGHSLHSAEAEAGKTHPHPE
ncbi:MAG: hypothetical protein HY237_07440 [Acidobacteria bacterium]|nr:hypothetical protein [Acidobacteriota bacterium]